MAIKKISTMSFPFPLGKISAGATFATASVPLTQNFVDGIERTRFGMLEIRAHPDNAKPIYLCNTAANPDLANYLNVIEILSGGEAWPRSKEWGNSIDISTIFIGAENATDFVIANITEN